MRTFNYTTLLNQIDENQNVIERNGELSIEIKQKINFKFRLDWNYYSNTMEGNSLTKMETRQLMMDNVTIDGKPFKDIAEMRGHDSVVQDIFKIGKGELKISESRIKKMHKAIMFEEDPDKQAFIGAWKTVDNYLINYRKERIDFLPHAEVPEAIHKLLNETNADIDANLQKKGDATHPAIIAFNFHLEYLKIHPFYDGNGRTGRLLMNLILISFGYPPVLLNEESRENYYKILTEVQAYGVDPSYLFYFLCGLLIDSQQIVMNAIAGKSIEDKDDLDKEIALWKQEIHQKDAKVQQRDEAGIAQVYVDSIRPLFQTFIEKTKQFDDLFLEKQIYNGLGSKRHPVHELEFFDNWIWLKSPLKENSDVKASFSMIELAKLVHDTDEFNKKYGDDDFERSNEMIIEISFRGFKNNGTDAFDEYIGFKVHFDRYNYRITKDRHAQGDVFKKLYTEQLTTTEIEGFVRDRVREVFENMKERVKKDEN